MTEPPLRLIPARRGTATLVRRHQRLKIINTPGTQVVDTWIFTLPAPASTAASDNPDAPLFPNATAGSLRAYSAPANVGASVPEYASMSHTRAALGKTHPGVGDALVSQKRQALATVVEDSSPRDHAHDTLVAACDRWRYAELGVEGYHENCTDNCWDALDAMLVAEEGGGLLSAEQRDGLRGLQARLGGRVPDPWNLFMNVPLRGEGYAKGLSLEAPVGREGDFVVVRAERDVVVVMSACPQDILEINGGKPADAHFQVLN